MTSMRVSKRTAMVSIVLALGILAVALALRPDRSVTIAAGPDAPGARLEAQYVRSPNSQAAPVARDAVRRTAVFPDLAEVTVLGVKAMSVDGQQRIVVDMSILGMRPDTIAPEQQIHMQLTDPRGQVVQGMSADPPLSTPLIGGDDRRFTLSWPAVPGQTRLQVWTTDQANGAEFRIAPVGGPR